jgi:CBS domain containing-hemolysin-like protein
MKCVVVVYMCVKKFRRIIHPHTSTTAIVNNVLYVERVFFQLLDKASRTIIDLNRSLYFFLFLSLSFICSPSFSLHLAHAFSLSLSPSLTPSLFFSHYFLYSLAPFHSRNKLLICQRLVLETQSKGTDII